MSWGKSIVLTFVLFAGFIGTMVFLMSRQRVDLVRDDYYQDELTYERQIERESNARQFVKESLVRYDADQQQLLLTRPEGLQRGTLTLYYPADRRQDARLTLSGNTPALSTVSMQNRPRGIWRAQLTWSDGQREYYTEEKITRP